MKLDPNKTFEFVDFWLYIVSAIIFLFIFFATDKHLAWLLCMCLCLIIADKNKKRNYAPK